MVNFQVVSEATVFYWRTLSAKQNIYKVFLSFSSNKQGMKYQNIKIEFTKATLKHQ